MRQVERVALEVRGTGGREGGREGGKGGKEGRKDWTIKDETE